MHSFCSITSSWTYWINLAFEYNHSYWWIRKDDPIFKDIPDNFTAPEVHGWAVLHVPDQYEVIADSGYVQAIKHKTKLIYGKQFHAEIKASYNQGVPFIKNFLELALA